MTTTTTQTADTPTLKPVVVVPPVPVVVSSRFLVAADRRRDWALALLAGGGIAMTLYATAVLYLVKLNVQYTFYLGIMAMIAILVLFTAIGGLLVKRTVNVSKNGVMLEDHDNGGDNQ